MNKIYKLKFSRKTNDLIVCSELATDAIAATTNATETNLTSAKGVTSSALSLSNVVRAGLVLGSGLALTVAGLAPAQALDGAQVVAGTATIQQNGLVTTITNSPNAIINWQNFNIGKNELVQFIQQSNNSAVLNRVLGNNVTEILGTLKSNGKVFLINPNGIMFGKSAVVDTQSLVASTLNMSNEDFLAGKYVFNQEKDAAIASVLNQGVIKVQNDGSLALVGGNVVNTGILEAKNGTVYLLAGQSIQVADLNNPLISFKVTAGNRAVNLGEIMAQNVSMVANKVSHGKDPYSNAFTDLYTDGVATQSRIAATGEVELFAGSVSEQLQTTKQTNDQVTGTRNGLVRVNAEISVANVAGKAGNVSVLGDQVHLGAQSFINASGVEGGNVYVGGDYQGKGSTKLATTTVTDQDQLISVSARGNAGSAIVWGDTLYVNGKLEATSVEGKGGLVETSGKSLQVQAGIRVNTTSQAGITYRGMWLLDPRKLHVVSQLPAGQQSVTATGDVFGDTKTTPADSYLLDTALVAALEANNVVLQTATSSQATVLFENANVVTTNKGTSLTLVTKNVIIQGSTVGVGNFLIDSGVCVTSISDSTFTGGKYTLTGSKSLTLTNTNINTNGGVVIESPIITTSGGSINANGITITSGGGTAKGQITATGTAFASTSDLVVNTLSTGVGNTITVDKAQFIAATKLNFNTYATKRAFTDTTLKATNVKISDQKVGEFKFSGGSITATDTVTITTADTTTSFNFNLEDTTVTAANDVTITANRGSKNSPANINGTTIESKNTRVVLNGADNLNFGTKQKAAKIIAPESISVDVKESQGSNVVNTEFTAKDISFNSDSAKGNAFAFDTATVTATEKAITITGHTVESIKSKFIAPQAITVTTKSGTFKSNDDTYTVSEGGTAITVEAELVETTGGTFKAPEKVEFNTYQTACISGTTIESKDIHFNGRQGAGELTITDGAQILASNEVRGNAATVNIKEGSTVKGATASFVGDALLNVERSTLNLANELTLTAGELNVKDSSKVTAGATTFKATTGAATIEASTVDVASLTMSAAGEVGIKDASQVTSKGALTTESKGATTVTGGSVVNAKDVTVTSAAGIEVRESNISSEGLASLNAQGSIEMITSNLTSDKFKLVTANDITLEGSYVVGYKETGEVTADNGISIASASNITAETDLIFNSKNGAFTLTDKSVVDSNTTRLNITADSVELGAGTLTIGHNEVNIETTGNGISADNANITVNHTQLILKSAAEVSLTNSHLESDKVDVQATGNVEITSTEVTARADAEDSFKVTGADITMTSVTAKATGTQISGKDGVHLEQTSITNTNPDSTHGISLTTEGALEVTGGTLEGPSVALDGDSVDLIGPDATVHATKTNVTVNAKNGMTATGGVTITACNTLQIASGAGVELDNVQLTTQHDKNGEGFTNSNPVAGAITVKAKGDITVNDVTSRNYPEDTGVTTFISEGGDISITQSDIESKGSLTLSGRNLTTEGSKLNARGGEFAGTFTGTVDVTDTDFTSKSIALTTEGDLTSNNSTLVATNGRSQVTGVGSVTLTEGTNVTGKSALVTTSGDLAITLTNIAATETTATIRAGGNVEINNANLSSKEALAVTSGGTLDLTDSALASTDGAVTVKAEDTITIASSTVTGNGDVTVESNTGSISATESSFTSKNGKVGLTVKQGTGGIEITDVNLTAKTQIEATSPGNLISNNSTIKTDGSVAFTSKDELILANGTNVSGKEAVTMTSTAGEIHVERANLTSAEAGVSLTSAGDIFLNTANVAAHHGITVNSDGELISNNATLTAETGAITLTGDQGITLANGTNVTAKNGMVTVDASVNGPITIERANITAAGENGKVELKAKDSITLDSSNVSGQAGLTVTAKEELTLNNATLTAVTGDVALTGDACVTLGNGTNVSANNGMVTVDATDRGAITIERANITAAGDNGKVELKAKDSITLNTSNVSAQIGISAKAEGELISNNATVTAKTGPITLAGDAGVTLANGTNVTAKDGAVTVDASVNGPITIERANITATGDNGKVELKAKDSITLDSSNVSGQAGLTVTAKDELIANNATLTAVTGDVALTGDAGVTLGNGTNVSANNGMVTVDASVGGPITIERANITAAGDNGKVELKAKDSITLNTSNVSAQTGVSAKAEGELISNNVTVTAETGAITLAGDAGVTLANGTNVTAKDGMVTVDASVNGPITIERANITATGTDSTVELKAKDSITLNSANVSAQSGLTVKSNEGEVVSNNATITVDAGPITIAGNAGVNLANGTNVTAKDGAIAVTSDVGPITLQRVNLTASGDDGLVSLKAADKITLDSTNVSAKTDFTVETKGEFVGNNATITATDGMVQVFGDAGVKLGEGTNVTAQGPITIDAKEGSFETNYVNLTSTNGNVSLKARDQVSLFHANISAVSGIDIESREADFNEGNSTLVVTDGGVSIKGQEGVALLNGTNISAKGGPIVVDGGNGGILINLSNLTSHDDKVVLTATKDIEINSANISAKTDVDLTSEGNTNISYSCITAGNVSITAGKDINIDPGNNITATGKVDMHATEKLIINQSNISGQAVKLVGDQEATLTEDNITNGNFELSGGNVFMNHSNVNLTGDAFFSSTGTLDLQNNTGVMRYLTITGAKGQPLTNVNNSWNFETPRSTNEALPNLFDDEWTRLNFLRDAAERDAVRDAVASNSLMLAADPNATLGNDRGSIQGPAAASAPGTSSPATSVSATGAPAAGTPATMKLGLEACQMLIAQQQQTATAKEPAKEPAKVAAPAQPQAQTTTAKKPKAKTTTTKAKSTAKKPATKLKASVGKAKVKTTYTKTLPKKVSKPKTTVKPKTPVKSKAVTKKAPVKVAPTTAPAVPMELPPECLPLLNSNTTPIK